MSDIPKVSVPTWGAASAAVEDESATALELFVYRHEPDDERQADKFREQLQGALDDVASHFQARLAQLEGQLAEARANDRTAMAYLAQVREVVGGKDFPEMVQRLEANFQNDAK